MFTYRRRHDGHGQPHYENTKIVPVRGIFASQLTKGQCSDPGDYWAWRLSGNCCLVREVRREDIPLTECQNWAHDICRRLGNWFQERRQSFTDLLIFEA